MDDIEEVSIDRVRLNPQDEDVDAAMGLAGVAEREEGVAAGPRLTPAKTALEARTAAEDPLGCRGASQAETCPVTLFNAMLGA